MKSAIGGLHFFMLRKRLQIPRGILNVSDNRLFQ